MTTKRRFAANVMMNWAAMAVGMAVPFFLTPLVVHRLGPEAYGVWILAISTVGYLNLLDLGMRSAIIRFVSKGQAEGNVAEVQRSLGAALWLRLLMSSAIALSSGLLAWGFPHFFKVPADLVHAAQKTVLLCALAIAIELTAGVFGAVLSGIHRFDVLSGISMVQTIVRAAGVVLILYSGRGLVSLAWLELAIAVAAGTTTWLICVALYPTSRFKLRRPEMKTLHSIWSYSFATFLLVIAGQVWYNADNIVVGAFLSMGVVVFYSIGGSLVIYSRQIVSAMATTFPPLASSLEAAGKMEELRHLLLRGTQATLGLALPVMVMLIFRGKTFIQLWMGARYGTVSETVLQILMISQFFSIANTTAGQIAFGMARHKAVARWAIIETALNLGLSVVLVKTMGLYGVAWGTAIATTIVHLIFWPRYVKKMVDVPVRTYIWDGWLKITLTAIPFAVAGFYTDKYWKAGSLVVFFAQVLAVLPVYVASVCIAFRSEVKAAFVKWRGSRRAATATALSQT